MKKLEDIPRQAPFKVPDGYFDQLPTVIQSRMAKAGRQSAGAGILSVSLKFALPIVVLVAVGIFWLKPAPVPETQLEDVDTEQIALYLSNVEHLDLEESNETTGWTKQELDQLEDKVYSNMQSNEEILNDVDLDNL